MITRKSTYEDVAAEYLADFPTLAAKKKTFQAKFGTLVKRSFSVASSPSILQKTSRNIPAYRFV